MTPYTFTNGGGVTYIYVGVTPNTRKSDGERTTLRVWQAQCKTCGAPFDRFTTLGADPAKCKAMQTTHCPAHRQTPAEALSIGRRAKEKLEKKRNRATVNGVAP